MDSAPTVTAAAAVDPEAEFLASKRRTGNEWELYKENVRPLKRGRDVSLLNEALKSQNDSLLRKTLLEKRRRLIDAIGEYTGEDPLQPWLDCIKWVQECFPAGGECSGLVVIYEQCVRTFWHDDRYKADLRHLKIWLEYAGHCADAEVIYRFLEANEIGQSWSVYYISYALHMESKNKLRRADEIFSVGIARKAQPLDKLEVAHRKFMLRSTASNKSMEDESADNNLPSRSFGTVLAARENRRIPADNAEAAKKKAKLQRIDSNAPLTIFDDSKSVRHQKEIPKSDLRSWHSLGSQRDRNKENTSIPSKWTSYKVPQKSGFSMASAAPSACIEVFVDESAKSQSTGTAASTKPSILKIRGASSRNLKKDTELLKENPLRNFPPSSLPR